ncbi:MAG: hypothetical protein R3200_04925 [Xanthomonadales bacterium]|nr:hypothetical protein [Xanthomonadales bacterium]
MSECNKCRQLIDRYGDSEPQERAWMRAHLEGCEACTEYKAAADATAALLGFRSVAAPPGARAFDALMERVRKGRRQTAIAAAAAMASLIALVWITVRHGFSPGSLILLAWLMGSGTFAWWSARRAQRHLAYRRSREFLESWRRDVNRKLLLTRLIAAVVSVEVLAWLALGATGGFNKGQPILLLVNGTLGVGAIYAWLVEIPTLVRERDLIHG